jgi:outer membrane immunogenic protein
MHKTLIATAALIGSFGVAAAADMARYHGSMKDEPVTAYGPSWAGLYAGGSTGYAWGDATLSVSGAKAPTQPAGGIYGAYVDYNFQHGNYVLGAEVSFNGAGMDDSIGLGVGTLRNEIGWYGTGVERLGYAAGDLLVYGFGGIAWGRVKTTIIGTGLNNDSTNVGWTAGFGVERMLGDRFSVRLEYAHVDLGSKDVFNGAPGCGCKEDASFDAVKVGLSYKLTGERPSNR